jgi:hypothetical protein
MTPRPGEIGLVDMGMAAKTRPTVVLTADNEGALYLWSSPAASGHQFTADRRG